MFNDYERQSFWKEDVKVKIVKCDSEDCWYNKKVGQVFKIESLSENNFKIKIGDVFKNIPSSDVEIVN